MPVPDDTAGINLVLKLPYLILKQSRRWHIELVAHGVEAKQMAVPDQATAGIHLVPSLPYYTLQSSMQIQRSALLDDWMLRAGDLK